MSETKIIIASIIRFLRGQLEDEELTTDARESIEVSVQCLEAVYGTSQESGLDLVELVSRRPAIDAESLKNEGNELMKADKFADAQKLYSRAIAMDPVNPVYFCNRAAAHFRLGEHEAAVADCAAALALRPDYGKAHGRLGLALAALDRHREARAAFARALQLEPDNETYRVNERQAAERARQQTPDMAGLLQNPSLMGMATEMLSDPQMQNLISGLVAGAPEPTGANRMSALLQAGHELAQQMQQSNPQLVEQLRRQVASQIGRDLPPEGGEEPEKQP